MDNESTIRMALESITEALEAATAHADNDGTGQQCSFHGDFSVTRQHPSTRREVRWWAKHLRKILTDNPGK